MTKFQEYGLNHLLAYLKVHPEFPMFYLSPLLETLLKTKRYVIVRSRKHYKRCIDLKLLQEKEYRYVYQLFANQEILEWTDDFAYACGVVRESKRALRELSRRQSSGTPN